MNEILIMFAATPVAIRSDTQKAFNIGVGSINGPKAVYIDTNQIERVEPLDTPMAGGTHWVSVTRLGVRGKGISDER